MKPPEHHSSDVPCIVEASPRREPTVEEKVAQGRQWYFQIMAHGDESKMPKCKTKADADELFLGYYVYSETHFEKDERD